MLKLVKTALVGDDDELYSAVVGTAAGAESAIEDGGGEGIGSAEYQQRTQKLAMVMDLSEASGWMGGLIPVIQPRFPYSRPEFLYFTDDEIAVSADSQTRPIVVPKDPTRMPLYAGYAECINAGKTTQNEDQAAARLLNFTQTGWTEHQVEDGPTLPKSDGTYFAIFDGHAGSGAAVMAANCLHEHIRDEQVAEEKRLWRIPGGCAALCVVFFLGKAYVANAGDCRAIVSSPPPPHKSSNKPPSSDTKQPATSSVVVLSRDFTPDNERKRLQLLAYRAQDLIGTAFTRLEYSRFLTRRDLKKKVLYRDWYMDGWAAKTVRDADIRPPLISDGPKKRRLLNTIGVTRGFGDHHLMTVDDNIPLKPFLSPVPEVQVFNLTTMDTLTDRDVLIMASDGLWDVLTNQQAHSIVQAALAQTDTDERSRYTMAAQDLVIAARGNPSGANGRWQLSPVTATGPTNASQPASTYHHHQLAAASTDDISCFVVPLKYALAPPVLEDDDDIELLA